MSRLSNILVIGTISSIFCQPIKRQIQRGVVPVFDGRVTLQPITFTFTTPNPKFNSIKAFPTLRPADFVTVPQIQNNNHLKEFKYDVQMPTQQQQFVFSTPVYSQAYNYKAIQASLQQDPYATYRTIWKQFIDTCLMLRNRLDSEGVGIDFQTFWQKLTVSVEPYVETFSSQFGKFINTFMKHQQDKDIFSMKRLNQGNG